MAEDHEARSRDSEAEQRQRQEERGTSSAQPLNEEQRRTLQDPQVEETHPDAFARKQFESDTPNPDSIDGGGSNPTEAQGGKGERTEDMQLDPSHEGADSTDDRENK